jgi:hypothetical protein
MSKSNRLDDWRRLNARRRAPARARLSLFMDDNGELVMGPARPDLTMVAFRWAWRYRNELWPFYAVLGLATIAGTAHDHAARLWPLGLLLGGAITAAAWRWRTNRLSERVYVLAVGGAATLWTACWCWVRLPSRWAPVRPDGGTTAGAGRSPCGVERRAAPDASCAGS